MPTIKNIGILVTITFLSLTPLWADTNTAPSRYILSVNPLLGVLYGQSEEIVYKYSNLDQYKSQLLWDLKPLVYAGFSADFGPRDPFHSHGIIAGGSVKVGLPLKTGIIEDRDWLNKTNELLTHYSRHDAYSHGAFLMDLSAGYSWPQTDYAILGIYGEFSYMYFSWSAENGYKQYVSDYVSKNGNGDYPMVWSSNLPKTPINGRGILYKQNWFILAPGLSLKARISRLFSLDVNFCYSPLIYCADRDDHLITKMTFWDYSYLGNYINGGGKLTFSIIKNLDLSLAFSYKHIQGTRGMTVEQEGSAPLYLASNDSGGTGYSVMDIAIAVKIRVYGRD